MHRQVSRSQDSNLWKDEEQIRHTAQSVTKPAGHDEARRKPQRPIGRCPDHSGERHCDHNQSDHYLDASVHDCLLRGRSITFGRPHDEDHAGARGWMNVHRRQFEQFSWRPPAAEDVIGSPAVTPSGQLLSVSSSSPQVPIRGIDGRFGDVDEVVGTALFLASDDAAFITALAIDCGT